MFFVYFYTSWEGVKKKKKKNLRIEGTRRNLQ